MLSTVQKRYETITSPEEMPDNCLYSYLLYQEMARVKRELTHAEKLTVLELYIAWYEKNMLDVPHREWVERNRERWSSYQSNKD